MSALDPRLDRVIAAERGMKRILGGLGVLMAIVGGGIIAAVVAQGHSQNLIAGIVFGALFLVPGGFMIRSWLRGPEHATSVRLLTVDRADLAGWELLYVSVNNGPTRPRIVLHRKKGMPVDVNLDQGEEDPVIAYVTEIAPRVQTRSG